MTETSGPSDIGTLILGKAWS